MDKWYVQASEPPRQLRREVTFHSDLAYGEGVFVVETPQLDKWWKQHPEPPRPLPRLTDRECLDFVSSMDARPDATAHFYPDYLRPLRRELYGHTDLAYGEGVFVKETTQLDKWWVAASEPTRNLRRALYGMGDITFVVEITLLSKWWQPASEPPRQLKRLPDPEGFRYGEGVFVIQTTTLDKWWQPTSLPVRPAQRIAPIAEGYNLFWAVLAGVFNPNAGFPYEQASEPPRTLKRLTDVEALRYGEGVFTKEVTQLDKWYQPASLPARPYQRQAPFAYSVVTTEITSLDKWWQTASLPVRPLQRIVPSMEGAFLNEMVFGPAAGFPWEQASEPPRFLRRLADVEALRYGEGVFVKETTTADRWYQPASLPVRLPRGLSPYTENVFTVETISLDKWWQPTSLPSRRRLSWTGDPQVQVFVLGMNVPVEFPFPEYHWVIPKQDTRYPYLEMAAPFIHSIPETQPVQALAWWGLTQQEGAWGVD